MGRKTSLWTALLVTAPAGAFTPGCTIVDSGLIDSLLAGDAGASDGAAGDGATGPRIAGDACKDDTDVTVITDSVELTVDTEGFSSTFNSNCSGTPTIGNDAFIPIDVLPGEVWHFHLAADPTDERSRDRDPAVFLVQESNDCDDRGCNNFSDECAGSFDEHFAFEPSAEGRWYVVIDDRQAGSGRYNLDAFRLLCGDGEVSHGENCDSGELCTNQCLAVLNNNRTMELEPNDTPPEANFVEIPIVGGEITISGAIGNGCYPDLYSIEVTAARPHIAISPEFPVGTPCDETSAPYEISVINRAGGVIDGTRVAGCPSFDRMLDPGSYVVSVDIPDQPDAPSPYRLKFEASTTR